MLAIPSPDLLLNLFASASQAIGLLLVLVGGAAWNRRGSASGGKRQGASRALVATLSVLLLACATAFLLYHLSVVDAHNQRLRTNLVRTSVEAGKQVGDVSLRTLDFSDQARHPSGITTDELAARVARGDALNLVDVREPEEVEVARIPGSWHRRYPDLMRDRAGLVRDGAETILLCESGNRSSELCDGFAKLDVPTRFLVGGYEKWVAEDRPVLGLQASERSDLRAIPDFPNKEVLLDTPDVVALVENEGAIFVDVRYPEDLARHALPGAINHPIRRMTSEAVAKAIAELPRRPIVVPCYDKRSSFYALILGIRLHRAGLDFRGRYSTPHEWFVPVAERAHVVRWREEQQGRTLLAALRAPFADALRWLEARAGLLVAILLLVLGLRLSLLPLTWRVERDSLRLAAIAPRLAELRARLGGDPVRLRRAITALLRAERIAPLRNLLSTSLQILLFVLLFAAVGAVAAASDATLLGAPLRAPDPTFVLPLLSGALVLGVLRSNGRAQSRLRAASRLLGAAVITALAWPLSLALQYYLGLSLGCALLHAWAARRLLQRPRRGDAPAPAGGELVLPLGRADGRADAGNKAARLAKLRRAGLPVPDGFVVCGQAFAGGIERLNGRLDRAWTELRTDRVAVRSSGIAEDGAQQSRAGVYESLLGIDRNGLEQALVSVHGSLRGERARELGGGDDSGGVVVQRMVPAEYAGVLFTEDPASAGCTLVELVEGLGDALVSGRADPRAYRFTRRLGHALDGTRAPIDLAPLLALGRRVEALFGQPQDIEWAFAGGEFQLLQARDITRTAADRDGAVGRRERERRRLLQLVADRPPQQPALVLTELCELLPEPTPYSLALMQALWAPGGSVDLACRQLGIPYSVAEDSPDYVVAAFGRMYVDAGEQQRRFARGLCALASLRLARDAEAIERRFRGEFAPALTRELAVRDAIDCSRLSLDELLRLQDEWRQRFVTATYVQAEIVNLAAEVHAADARRRLARQQLDPSVVLAAIPRTELRGAWETLGAGGDAAVATFLARCGHRAAHDFELAEPRYRETPELVAAMAAGAPADVKRREPPPVAVHGRVLRLVVDRALRFQALKEDAKHVCLRELAGIRALLLAIGGRTGLHEDVFFLTPDEIARLGSPAERAALGGVAAARRAARAEWLALELPNELRPCDLETLFVPFAARTRPPAEDGVAHGERVAGDRDPVGRARVLHDPAEATELAAGEILVARFTDPSWTPLFRRAGGIVTEVGGWLSHAAIQARELNLPAIVGAGGAMSVFATGDLIALGQDGSVRRIADRRVRARRPLDRDAVLVLADDARPVRLVDVSETGARLRCPELPIGARVRLRVDGDERDGEVVRQTGDGVALRYA
jgi:rhodanese-related sulfurtransferase/phosphohistidine swiveling domain-containing protein